MWRYALRRLMFLPLIVIGMSLITFLVIRVLPNQDPARILAGQGATDEQVEEIRERLGLSDPLHEQYLRWIGNVLTGDFGRTYGSDQSVREQVVRKFPASFELIFLSLAVSSIAGVSFGVLSAMYRNSLLDYVVRIFAVLGQSIPEFFLLSLLIIIPSYLWNYSQPIGGYVAIYDDPWTNLRLFGPAALIIGLGGSAGMMRLVRTTMLEVLRADYVRTANAKGLRQRTVVMTHAFRNALTPIVTALGSAFLLIFGGSVIAERVLSIPGLGLFFFQSVLTRDFPVVQFLVLYIGTAVVLINLIVDLSYAYIDPRVKYT